MAGIIGIRAEDMEQVDALRKLRPDYPDGFPLVRPHVLAPMLVQRDQGLEARLARFGFSRRFSSFNAREDRLTTGKMWSRMFGSAHALIPVSYVVEWVAQEGERLPYLIQRADGRPMMAPALYGHSHEKKEEYAFAICTRTPNQFFARFHDRMIGQCPEDLQDAWLRPGGGNEAQWRACIAAPGNEELVAVPTDPAITKRKAGDWSALRAIGKPLRWADVESDA